MLASSRTYGQKTVGCFLKTMLTILMCVNRLADAVACGFLVTVMLLIMNSLVPEKKKGGPQRSPPL